MPLGVMQNNSFLKLTLDVWQDKVFYCAREYPAGYFAASVLDISDDELFKTMEASAAVLAHHQLITAGSKEQLGELLPSLKAELLRLAELLWRYPPFCFNDKEQERHLIDVMLAPETLNDIARPDSPGRDFFLRYLDAIVRVPAALYHFVYAVRYFEAGYLRRLKKRNETFFAVATHDCFTSEEFWMTMDGLEAPDVERFTSIPELRSAYVFARHPTKGGETIFVNRYFFDSTISFYTFDLINGLHHGHAPSQCHSCGKYFLTTNGHIPKYCDGIAPQDSRYTCRQYGAMMRQKEQNKQHPIYRLFATRTDTIRKHHQRGKISDDLRREALYLAESYRDKALMDNNYAESGYAQDMELEQIYAEAEKRLK